MTRPLILVTLLAALAAGPAVAGGSIGLMIAAWDTQDADTDNGLGAKVDFDIGGPFAVTVRYADFDGFTALAAGRLLELQAAPLDLGVVYNFESQPRINPYVGAGLTSTNFDARVVASPLPRQERVRLSDEPGWFAVGGLEVKVSNRLAVFGEALYRQTKAEVEGEGLDSFAKVQLDFAGPAGSVGLLFTW